MKKYLISAFAGIMIFSAWLLPADCYSQTSRSAINKYLKHLPTGKPADDGTPQKYRMTAVYTNRDLYGNFTGKIRVVGDYTRGFADGYVRWNNASIANSSSPDGPFPEGVKLEYMENMRYFPSDELIKEEAFSNFPSTTENVFARNLVWDMMSFEIFAWRYLDSLKLNQPYLVPDIKGEFDLADIGKYFHNKILVCWKGVTEINGEMCALLEFSAVDNIIEISMNQINTKGTEQYWGTVILSLATKNIEQAVMYSGTMQEIEITGFENKFLAKTIRELWLERIR